MHADDRILGWHMPLAGIFMSGPDGILSGEGEESESAFCRSWASSFPSPQLLTASPRHSTTLLSRLPGQRRVISSSGWQTALTSCLEQKLRLQLLNLESVIIRRLQNQSFSFLLYLVLSAVPVSLHTRYWESYKLCSSGQESQDAENWLKRATMRNQQ